MIPLINLRPFVANSPGQAGSGISEALNPACSGLEKALWRLSTAWFALESPEFPVHSVEYETAGVFAVPLSRPAFAAVLGLASLFALPAAAQMGPPKLDQNGDGRVVYAEYRSANVDKTFETFDADRNGQISRKEFDKFAGMARTFGGARAAAAMDRWWRTTDVNTDGAMSRAEMEASSRRRFDAADLDRDGALTKTEVAAMRERQRAASGN